MYNLNFNYLQAENFLCFGPDGIEFRLNEYGKVVLVRGVDMDRFKHMSQEEVDRLDDEELRRASNGVGKSSIPEILVYTLYGKTIKPKLGHEMVVHNKVGKRLKTEVRWGKYRVVRTRKPNSLRLWENEDKTFPDDIEDKEFNLKHEITLGGMPATQELIESKLGLSYQAFVNTMIFTDRNADAFMECDAPTKREIVENLLSLGEYREHLESAKTKKNEFKNKLDVLAREYQSFVVDLEQSKNRIVKIRQQEEAWKQSKTQEMSVIQSNIAAKQKKLGQTDVGEALNRYNEAQDKIVKNNALLPGYRENLAKAKVVIDEVSSAISELKLKQFDVKNKTSTVRNNISNISTKIKEGNSTISSFEAKKGTKCPVCLGTVKEENFATCKEEITKKNFEYEAQLLTIQEEAKQLQDKVVEYDTSIAKQTGNLAIIQKRYDEIYNKISFVQNENTQLAKITKPEAGIDEKVIAGQIEELKKQLVLKEGEIKGPSPFVGILKNTEEEIAIKEEQCKQKRKELDDNEKDLPYYEFWVKAFGDTGIRKFVIEGIIPALNSSISYWLQFLMDGKVKLVFDNEFNETIEHNPADGEPFVYYGLSGGEKRCINLAISQAFAGVMSINSGVSPSLVFLDEVTTNIDVDRVENVNNMIKELSKNKQVFVTTHSRDLLEMLAGCDTINLLKNNRFTTLNNS